MRKAILLGLLAATVTPVMASAQTPELRHDRREIREERRDLRDAQRYGDHRDVREAREDLRDARREHREDWRDYRRTNRNVYHQPAYVGPRGYRYRPVVVGHRFEPAYYGRRYIVADPWRYRLPAANGDRRWVRYGNDVALVNIRNGRVIQVYNSFFW
jgi:Ni/Co efflux regulator RcnB